MAQKATTCDEEQPEDDARGDRVTIRTDDGVIDATVNYATGRPEDGSRLSGAVVECDNPDVHYVDYHEGEGDTFVPDEIPADEWSRMTTPRVRALVEGVYENARGQDPEVEVLKAGDTGVMFRTRYDGGCVGRRFFETVENHGFQVADLNTGSGKILVRDRTKVDD